MLVSSEGDSLSWTYLDSANSRNRGGSLSQTYLDSSSSRDCKSLECNWSIQNYVKIASILQCKTYLVFAQPSIAGYIFTVFFYGEVPSVLADSRCARRTKHSYSLVMCGANF